MPTTEKLHINGFGTKMSFLSEDVRLLSQKWSKAVDHNPTLIFYFSIVTRV